MRQIREIEPQIPCVGFFLQCFKYEGHIPHTVFSSFLFSHCVHFYSLLCRLEKRTRDRLQKKKIEEIIERETVA